MARSPAPWLANDSEDNSPRNGRGDIGQDALVAWTRTAKPSCVPIRDRGGGGVILTSAPASHESSRADGLAEGVHSSSRPANPYLEVQRYLASEVVSITYYRLLRRRSAAAFFFGVVIAWTCALLRSSAAR